MVVAATIGVIEAVNFFYFLNFLQGILRSFNFTGDWQADPSMNIRSSGSRSMGHPSGGVLYGAALDLDGVHVF
jgi:hypothetical protein